MAGSQGSATAVSYTSAAAATQIGKGGAVANALSVTSARAGYSSAGRVTKLTRTMTIRGALNEGAVAVDLGLVRLAGDSPTEARVVVGVIDAQARLQVGVPTPPVPFVRRKARLDVRMDYDDPVMIGNEAYAPTYSGHIDVTSKATTGKGHITVIDNPEPVWADDHYDVAPPPAPDGAAFWRWTANSFPAASVPGVLGDLTADDGTNFAGGIATWDPEGGSASTTSWGSLAPFKPLVAVAPHFGAPVPAGPTLTALQAIHFDSSTVDHITADFGDRLGERFTVLLVARANRFDRDGGWVNLLSSGQSLAAQTTLAQRRDLGQRGVTGPLELPTEASAEEQLLLRVSTTTAQLYLDAAGAAPRASTHYANTYRPQVFAVAVDGGSGRLYVRGPAARRVARFTCNSVAHRYLAVGRAAGVLDIDAGADMTLFEARVWDRALSESDLDAHYDQLSSTWKFAAYQ